MHRPRSAYFFLVLCWALSVIAYTPCSYDAWVDGFQSCMQPCYGEQYYDAIFNTTKCGNYSTGASSTLRSHVKCLCETASFTLQSTNKSEICKAKNLCYNTSYYNATLYEDVTLSFLNMCSWARGGMWFFIT
jgi:hypothetical protein